MGHRQRHRRFELRPPFNVYHSLPGKHATLVPIVPSQSGLSYPPDVVSERVNHLRDLLFEALECLDRHSFALLLLVERFGNEGALFILQYFYLSLEFDDFPFHLFVGFIESWQFDSAFFEVEGVLVQHIELLGSHVFVPFSFVGKEGVELPQPIPQLGPFLLQLLDLSLQLTALCLVVLQLLFLCYLDVLQIEAEVLGYPMQLPQYFVLCQ